MSLKVYSAQLSSTHIKRFVLVQMLVYGFSINSYTNNYGSAMKLTHTQIKNAKAKDKNYKLTDGQGMYLLVHKNGSKYWRLNYRFDRKQKTLALGTYPLVSLAEARQACLEAKLLLAEGIDPNQERKDQAEQRELQTTTSFEYIARQWHSSNNRWTTKHKTRILRSLEQYIFPSLGDTPIDELRTPDLLNPVKKVDQLGYHDTARRLQQRITAIMRFAVQNGLIEHNPALDMAGALSVNQTTHRPSLDLNQIPDLLNRIEHKHTGRELTRLALQFAILTFVRSSEMRYARWHEIDFENAIWTIPAEREAIEGSPFSQRGSKMRTPHIVPLSKQALSILQKIHHYSGMYELIFIGDHNPYRPMSENTINKALRNLGYDTKTELCGHGFRTMACSALIESGHWSKDSVERQMSHQERNSVRAAYIHKAEHLEERQQMMQWWADYIDANKNHYISPFSFNK